MRKGFTLLELLIVMAILAILASILLVVVKPQQIFAKARDTQRKSDLRNLAQAIEVYMSETTTGANLTANFASANAGCLGNASSTIYYSTSGGVATAPTGFSTANLSSTNATDGTGWLPINFKSVASLNLNALPVDPSNTANNATQSLYYTYGCRSSNATYELDGRLEVLTADEANDGGNNPQVYEVGTDKTILPAATSTTFYQQS